MTVYDDISLLIHWNLTGISPESQGKLEEISRKSPGNLEEN